jgi:hypothetical protein
MTEEPSWFRFHLRINPSLDRLRGDPRFEPLIDRVQPALAK